MSWIADNRLFSVSPKRTCRIFCTYDPETGRKYWFFSFASKVSGPFESLAEADEELFEFLVARKNAALETGRESTGYPP